MRLSERMLSLTTQVCNNSINLVVDIICDEGVCAHRYACTPKPVNGDTVVNFGQTLEVGVGRQGLVDDVLCLTLRRMTVWKECVPFGDIEVEAEIVFATFT